MNSGRGPGRAVRVTTGLSAAAVVLGVAVLVVGCGLSCDRRAAFVVGSCLATLLVPVVIHVWGGRAPDRDARFARVLTSLSGYLLPMIVFQEVYAASAL